MPGCEQVENAVDVVMRAIAVPYSRTVHFKSDSVTVEVKFLGRTWSRCYKDPAQLQSSAAIGALVTDPLKEWAVRGRSFAAVPRR
jgi:hypothetical protein